MSTTPVQPFASILLKTMPRQELVSVFSKNTDRLPIEPFLMRADAFLKVVVSCCTTSRSVGIGNSSILGPNFVPKSFPEMAPIIQGEVIVIMGVSGAGKTTIGNLLAKALNCAFLDADDFHPDSNKEKMRKGMPLSEEDRMPWLQVLCKTLKERTTDGESAVLACSALRKNYREILRSSDPNYAPGIHSSSVKFVLLDVPVRVLSDRLNKRLAKGEHYMPPTLLQSQLELLEIDASEGILQVDATQSPSAILTIIQDSLSQSRIL